MSSNAGGKFYWVRNQTEEKVRGIVAIFAWVSVHESDLQGYVNLYSSLGWSSLVCLADFLNPFLPQRATSLAFAVLNALVEELKICPCPVVLAAFSGGSKACMYKVIQVIEGVCEAELSLEDTRLVRSCISGQIYDSSPVDFSGDLGARFALHPSVVKMPGSVKILSLIAKGVTSGLDALFLTRFGSHHSEYWKTLFSSVSLGAPFLILCSENDELAPYATIYNFAQRLQEVGGCVKLVKWKNSPHAGHYKHCPIQYRDSVTELLQQAVSVYSQKIKGLGERCYIEGMPDQITELICDLQDGGNSEPSFRRVGSNDHFPSPGSPENGSVRECGSLSLQDETKDGSPNLSNSPSMSVHSVLGQVLFDACVPKNVEGWDIKFSGSLNGQPLASARKNSPLSTIKRMRRARL